MKPCIACAEDIKPDAKLCKHCGTRQDDPAFLPPSEIGKKAEPALKEPRLSFPPSGDEYPEGFAEAAEIWNGWDVWQRRIWNEAGRPNLLTYRGAEFEEWIIDTADEGFDFDAFVSDWANKESLSSPAEAELKNRVAPWALGFGIASVFLFEFLIPMMAAIPLGAVGVQRASELKRAQATKTGFVQSLIGLILGIVYVFLAILLGMGFGP